ncbi:MAG: YigZ family protein [Candidatus Gracilibacteria bacterium]|nr:YigZ family protein [Candidatus Gracilibacteria bacterium]
MTDRLSFDFFGKTPKYKRKILKDVIIDRKSKYTSILGFVISKEEVESFMKDILTDSYFKKATHNTFAYRIKLENGSVLEGKNDDGEVGAGMCILRELQREDFINTIVVVTRYFGGIHLQSDRFKNVIDATKIILKENENS